MKTIDLEKIYEYCNSELDTNNEIDLNALSVYLVQERVFKSQTDIAIFILECLPKIINNDATELPIKYYTDEDDLDELEEIDALTDKYIRYLN